MEIELLRDIVITVSGIVVTLAAIYLVMIAFLLYRKINKILKSVNTAATKMEALATIASDEIGKPLIQTAGLIQGITYGISRISKIFKKGE